MDKNFEIKILTEKDIESFNALLRYAFQVTSKELKETGYSPDLMKRSKKPMFDYSHIIGWFYKGELASQIVVMPAELNIYDEIYEIGMITGVTTYPEFSGLGLAHGLMKEALKYLKDEGRSLAILCPYSIPFYRKMGFEVISDIMTFKIKDNQLPKKKKVNGMIERVDIFDEDIKNIYKYYSLQHHGLLLRNDIIWQEDYRYEKKDDLLGAVYYNEQEKPLGYMIYYIEDDAMHIKELVYLNWEAKTGLWNFISAHYSMLDYVTGYNYSSESISFSFDDSEFEETIKPNIMGRIVDVEAFLSKFPYQVTNLKIKMVFEVTDDLVSWNNGLFELTFVDDEATIRRVSDEEVEDVHKIKLNINTLTTMFMGYKRPDFLYNNEYIDMDYHFLKYLEMLIPTKKVTFMDYF